MLRALVIETGRVAILVALEVWRVTATVHESLTQQAGTLKKMSLSILCKEFY